MSLLTTARNLTRRKARERDGLFVAEGIRAVEELLRSPLAVRGLLVAPKLAEHPRAGALHELAAGRGVPIVEVGDREFASAADTESPQGVLAVAGIPERSLAGLAVGDPLRVLVLDGVQDPGNVGTILRTAAALGVTACVALPGTVDLWNAKVVRSAMGALFHASAFHSSWDELDAFLARATCPLWAADASGTPVSDLVAPSRLALAVGNEGAGLSDALRERAARTVSLPIRDVVESLNVAVAAGILLHVLRP
jgi:TrmH family RNA methyltransferase